jgi:hypothetical protein
MNREELAWAAGFFDGEGWTGLRGPTTVGMSVTQMELQPLVRFHNAVGVGTIYGRGTRGGWIWQAGNWADSQAAVAKLWRFMSEPKRAQAHAALREAIQGRSTSRSRHRNGRKTHCLREHPFSEENTYYDKLGRRVCKTCRGVRRSVIVDP